MSPSQKSREAYFLIAIAIGCLFGSGYRNLTRDTPPPTPICEVPEAPTEAAASLRFVQ